MKRQQPHITSLFLAALLLLSQPMLFAEILVDGQVSRTFRIDNISQFSDYNFFYRYQSYDLKGDEYVASEITEVPLREGETYGTQMGSLALIVAKPKSGIGEELIASKTLGGFEPTSNADLNNVTEVVQITRITDDAFSIKVTHFMRHFNDGTSQVIANSKMREMVELFKVDKASSVQVLSYTMLPILIIVFLFSIQLWRRRNEAKTPMGRIISLKKRVVMSGTDPVVTD